MDTKGISNSEKLHSAAWTGDISIVQQLVAQGADINIWDKWGRTALSLAASNGHIKVVQVLLQAGAWVEPHEDYDTFETPLIAAAEKGRLEVVRMLCSAGADPRIHGGISQQTAGSYARVNGHREVADYLASLEETMAREASQRRQE